MSAKEISFAFRRANQNRDPDFSCGCWVSLQQNKIGDVEVTERNASISKLVKTLRRVFTNNLPMAGVLL